MIFVIGVMFGYFCKSPDKKKKTAQSAWIRAGKFIPNDVTLFSTGEKHNQKKMERRYLVRMARYNLLNNQNGSHAQQQYNDNYLYRKREQTQQKRRQLTSSLEVNDEFLETSSQESKSWYS